MTHPSRRQFLAWCALGAAGTAFGADNGGAGAESFTVAAINDIHITDAASTALLDKAVARINADGRIRFVAALGDMATIGKIEELTLAKASLDRLKPRCFVVPGNHDVAMQPDNPFDNYRSVFGDLHWVHEDGGWTFIGFNSCELAMSDVTVSPEEIAWLKEQAARIEAQRPVAIFCHHPLNPHTRQYRIKNADEVLAVFEGRALKLAAAGHWHGNQVEEQGGVLFTTTACCTATRDNFDGTSEKGYRLFHLTGRTVATEFVPVA